MSRTYEEVLAFIENKTVINTHSHHMADEEFDSFNLDRLMENSYVNWLGITFGGCYASRKAALQKVGSSSYFTWLQKGIQSVYGISEPITADNWDRISLNVSDAHRDKEFHIKVLSDVCSYSNIIEDAYWNPGSDNGYPQLFNPAFRINPFLFGYSPSASDHGGHNALSLYNRRISDIDEYMGFVREKITEKKQQGCIALKLPVAYDRGLDFVETAKDKAQRAFLPEASEEEIKAFQDYVVFGICRIAAELDLPIQCHTGMGKVLRSNAMWLREVIEKNSDTKFVLFHCSYPWIEDINALVRTFGNVYPDICWLPLLSPSAAKRMLHELIEDGAFYKTCWGCDTWTSEESYGALLAFRYVLASVLSERVEDGFLSMEDARMIADGILNNNARSIYGL
jgi:predicted TIM-barrel fold metal-dependent hydrolase